MFSSLYGFAALGLFILRAAVAAVFLVHGWPKIKMPAGMAKGMGWPDGAVILLGSVECLSALCVLSGLYLQLAAVAMCVVMLGATYHKVFKWKMPFKADNATGWELDTVLFCAAFMLATNGGGSIGL
jgi:uncharacterized membrane protein YphA (DoxX/SURF4 family)